MRIILIVSAMLVFNSLAAYSQSLAINTTGAISDASAGLDINFSNKGLLIPRVNLTAVTDVTTISNPATGLIVYNTNSTMTDGNGVGYYYYCSSGCSNIGWKFLCFADNISNIPGQVLTSQGNGLHPQWGTPALPEWTYFSKVTFNNQSGQNDFVGLPTHDNWKLTYNLKNNGSTAGEAITVRMGINGVTTGYTYAYSSISGINSPTEPGTPPVKLCQSGVGFDSYIGEVIISGKHNTNNGCKNFYGTGSGQLISSTALFSGFLTGNSVDVNSINIISSNTITGSFELWYKDNK